jgi:hypothetical protein
MQQFYRKYQETTRFYRKFSFPITRFVRYFPRVLESLPQMLENVIDFTTQLKAFYKTRYKYVNYISPIALTYIKRLYKELERLLSLAL